MDWKTIAPKRSDRERLSARFTAEGLPHCRWTNGVAVFSRDLTADEVRLVQAIATMEHTHEVPKEAPVDYPGPVQPPKKKRKR